jgi:uncharacterized RDD family membrane protein YckC
LSILPLPTPDPEIAPLTGTDIAPNATPGPSFGIHLTTLDSYAGEANGLRGVTFWPRVAARLIDLVAHYVISFGAGIVIGVMVTVVARLQHDPRPLLALRRPGHGGALFLFALLGSIALQTMCEGFHGSSLGKILLGFVVVQEDGTPCRFGSAVIRDLAYFIDSLFFGFVGYHAMQKTPQEQRHGDEWAHTVVCRRSDVAPGNLRSVGSFLMVFLLAAMADTAFDMIGTLFKILS